MELKDDMAELLMVVHKLQNGKQQMWILPFLVNLQFHECMLLFY